MWWLLLSLIVICGKNLKNIARRTHRLSQLQKKKPQKSQAPIQNHSLSGFKRPIFKKVGNKIETAIVFVYFPFSSWFYFILPESLAE